MRLAIDQFNERLAFLATHYPNFRHVDLRGTVAANEWFDGEIHPKATAAQRLAQRVATALGPALGCPNGSGIEKDRTRSHES